MQTETVESFEVTADADPPLAEAVLPAAAPVLAYSSPSTLIPGPTLSDILWTGLGIILAVVHLAWAGVFLFWILQLAVNGYEFGSLALLAPFAALLSLGRGGIRIAGRNLPGARASAEFRGEEALREFRDIPSGVLTTIFGLTLFAILLLVVRDLFQEGGSPKKIVATAMIVIVLLYGMTRTFQSAWRQLGAGRGRGIPSPRQDEHA